MAEENAPRAEGAAGRRTEGAAPSAAPLTGEFFRHLHDAGLVLEAVAGPDGWISDFVAVEVNAAALEAIGARREDVLGRRATELFGDVVRPLLPAWREVLRGGQPGRLDVQLRPGGKHYLSSHFRLAPRLVGCALLDVTELREARLALEERDEALRASEEQLRLFVEHAPAAVAMLDRDMRYLAVSRRFLADYGIPERSVIGRSHYEVFPEVPEHWKAVHRRCLAGAVERCEEEAFPRLDGTTDWVRWEIVPWRDARGAVGGIMLFTENITARKRAEEALREADRHKTEFLALLSHELRNPLAPIRNSILLLERAPAGGEVARRAREVLARQTEHLARLVDDLLDISRISHGKIALQLATLDAREAVRRACADARGLFEQKGVALLEPDPGAPVWVPADAVRLAQLVGNLLQNALKFTPQGGEVRAGVSLREGGCEVSVRDTGQGIEPPDLERIFDPFVQSERTRATQGGLGIGLALVRELAELHGGSVRAESAGAGAGAEFVVRLPLAAQPAGPRDERGAPGPAALSVLVVEDNPDAAATLADILDLSGHRVRTAPTGRAGIDAAIADPPDVLVCDLGLPDVSGHEVVRAIRATAAGRRVYAIALTGHALPHDRDEALAAGFDAHLAKPSSLEALERLLRAAAERRGAG